MDFKGFKGAAKRLDDVDLPRIADTIGVGEDELHMLLDVETTGKGFDDHGRPRILFEPAQFYQHLPADKRSLAVSQGLACASWGGIPYGTEASQYPKLQRAMLIDERIALESCSWSISQVMGFNHVMAGYDSVYDMVQAAMDDEENGLKMMVSFIKASHLDDDLRVLAALKRPTTPDDCRSIARGYNGNGYAKNEYHTKMAARHNFWRNIKNTVWVKGVGIVPAPAVRPPQPQTNIGPGPIAAFPPPAAPLPAPSPSPTVAPPAPKPPAEGFWAGLLRGLRGNR